MKRTNLSCKTQSENRPIRRRDRKSSRWQANTNSLLAFENTPCHIPTSHFPAFLLWQVHRRLSEVNGMSQWTFSWPRDLLWPMSLTYELDLDILPFDPHAKIQVRMSVCSAIILRRTDTQTHTQTDNTKTITPITSETWGVITTTFWISWRGVGGLTRLPLGAGEWCDASLAAHCGIKHGHMPSWKDVYKPLKGSWRSPL